jgi:hypothetical protein
VTCLPGTGGPTLGLLLLGFGLLALGFALVARKRGIRAMWASLVVVAMLAVSTLSTTDAHAADGLNGAGTSQDCPPGTGAGTGDDGGDAGSGDGDGTTTSYDVTYSPGVGGTIDGDTSQRVRAGRDATPVTAVPDASHRFTEWSDGVTTALRQDRDVAADINVTAQFALRQYTLTYTAGPGGAVGGTSPQTVEHGTDGTAVTAVANPGSTFVRWSDGSTTNPRTDTNVTADVDVTAEFTTITYDVTYAAGPGGSITGDADQTVAHGSDAATVTAAPDTGYRFVQWSDGSTTNPRTDAAVVADISVTAEFALITYRLQYSAGTGGSLTGDDDQSVDHGSDGTAVTAVPDEGYEFLRWSDGRTTNPRTDTNVTADASIAAVFEINEYALTYVAGTGGTLTGSASQTVEHGSDGTAVTAVPDTGHRFVRWSDGSTTNPRTDTDVVADLSVTAQFAVLTYRLQYSADTGGTITGDADQTVDHGTDGTAVTATADAGHRFVQWSDGSTTNPRTDTTVVADLSVTAEFEQAEALPLHGVYDDELTDDSPESVSFHNPDATEAEYLLVPTNTGSQANQVSVGITGNAPLTGADPGGSAALADPHSADRRDAVALVEARRGGVGPGAPLVPPAQVPSGAVPVLGDSMTLNGNPGHSCATGEVVTATVTGVGARVIVATDDANPPGSLNVVEYQELVEELDIVVAAVSDELGATSDIDDNDRIVVLLTREVNELSPPATPAVDFALSRPRDLLDQVECPTSNVGEVFYAMAPDQTGAVNANVRTISQVRGNIPRDVAHELGHQIVDAARLDAGTPLDDTWLGEAIADIAIDAVFWARSIGLTPLQNLPVGPITSGPNASRRVAAFNTYVNANYSRYRPWLQSPTRNPVFAATPSPASRGGAWAFLNYAADRVAGGSLTDRTAFLASLVTGSTVGTPALATAIGADPWTWLEEFAVAAYTDDQADAGALGTTGPFAMTSWNYRSFYTALNGSYQLSVAALDAGDSMTSTYAPNGGSRHIRFVVAAGGTATITLTSLDVPDPSVGYRVVRLR